MSARQTFRKALMLLDRGMTDRGEATLCLALAEAEQEGDRVALAQSLVALGDLMCETSRGVSARPLLERALAAASDTDAGVLAFERDKAEQLLARIECERIGLHIHGLEDFKNRTFKLAEFIAVVRAKAERREGYDPAWLYDVYGEDGDAQLRPHHTIYIGDTVQVDDEKREIYPEKVAELGYVFQYSCEHFQDVVDLAYRQKPDASIEDVVRCLNHFDRYDDFLDLGPYGEQSQA
ncbi:DUF7716 domain-containing protein [Burkholderia lata]|uniref:DUF7716 domain-containing protein n=1 Tax=Burkholderia lata (strain ATCC 17760 / DSM 23089 / LMG 22485 / NCIMB 9086 / R18194 / 383) TaxID=482957 RepID=A0A6P2K137_BURL3|nr:hypothetical protein [Burkholderia lata]VWB48471.1 hypothetical protein BLA6863_02197 [Burkholderia lata]